MKILRTTLALAALAFPPVPALTADAPQFLILVHGGDRAARTAVEQKAVVQEYVAWAHALRDGNHLVSADELAETSRVLTARNPAGAERKASAGGYFLVTAKDLDGALALAKDCPALKHGGSVEVTAIHAN